MSKLSQIQEVIERTESHQAAMLSDLARWNGPKDHRYYTDRVAEFKNCEEALTRLRQAELDEILGPGGEIPAAEPVPAR